MRACQVARSRWTIPSVTLVGAAAATGSVTGTARGRWQILVRFIDGTLSVVTVSLSGTEDRLFERSRRVFRLPW